MSFCELDFRDVQENPFTLIGDDWMLITAADGARANTMTASWGGLGILWKKPVAFSFIRPQRYTKEFVDRAGCYSLCFFEGMHRELGYLGRVSGREEDKIAKSGLTTLYEDGVPYFAEAKLVLFCKTLYRQPMTPAAMVDPSLDGAFYPEQDYHEQYVGEITRIFKKQG